MAKEVWGGTDQAVLDALLVRRGADDKVTSINRATRRAKK